jgi:hypothetical protein
VFRLHSILKMLFSAPYNTAWYKRNVYLFLTQAVPIYSCCMQYLSDWILNNAVTQINAQQRTYLIKSYYDL